MNMEQIRGNIITANNNYIYIHESLITVDNQNETTELLGITTLLSVIIIMLDLGLPTPL